MFCSIPDFVTPWARFTLLAPFANARYRGPLRSQDVSRELFPLNQMSEEAVPKLCSPMETRVHCSHGVLGAVDLEGSWYDGN
jgi:hypothetical protein